MVHAAYQILPLVLLILVSQSAHWGSAEVSTRKQAENIEDIERVKNPPPPQWIVPGVHDHGS